MATAYNSDTYADIQLNAPWGAAQAWIRPFSFNIANTTAAVGFALNDTLALCPIPYKDGVYVVDFHLDIPSLDGGNSVRVSLGDTNGTANAFQAVWYTTAELGSNVASSVNGTLAIGATHVAATVIPKTTGLGAELPHLYAVSTLYSGYTAWPTINFEMKITTAPNTATTTGTIRGWLMLQTYQGSTSGSF